MRYRLFGRTGLRVSTLSLGTGVFGTGWGYGTEASAARAIYDAYRGAGGNFIDTADSYQFGQSETFLGEFIGNDRDDIVLATKFALGAAPDAGLQATGNSRKTMRQSVEASLKRLKTDRIDLLWVHMPDGVTPIEEILRGLDDLARAGKILYAGLSDFPAWRVATAATIAELRGTLPLGALQIEYSLVERTPERELLPMAAAFGLGTVAWSPLGGGLLTGKYRKGETGRAQGLGAVIHSEDDERKVAVVDAVLAVAEEAGVSPGQVAIAWVLSKGVLPIIGPRTVEQLTDNLGAAAVALSAEQIARLDRASAVPLGFPHDLVAGRRGALFAKKLGDTDVASFGIR
ncbi:MULTISPECIES: aldo/keto reductase [unclassified Aureimonas]|uniref:aldo/keto reductase n=1 Tax=unclassified Aureimonas TaxID=2615206 RepID=UPI0007006DEE|nr:MULTISPECIES: aldo/keto reductase [unclassified Aureimonas]KQT69862.1 oxidoreductase [Aureimonas sp. Leaf427]KQT75985.1 oxidoreductase [Aureimonas sp. Leaf460]